VPQFVDDLDEVSGVTHDNVEPARLKRPDVNQLLMLGQPMFGPVMIRPVSEAALPKPS
jgi:hypothetical protein